MAQLPIEIAEIVFNHLDRDCHNAGLVCRVWHAIYLRTIWQTLNVEVYEHFISFRNKIAYYDVAIKALILPDESIRIDTRTVKQLNEVLLAVERARQHIRELRILFLQAPITDSITISNVLRSLCCAARPLNLVCNVGYGADWTTAYAVMDLVSAATLPEMDKRVAIQAVDADNERFATRLLQRIREKHQDTGAPAIEFLLARDISLSFFRDYGDAIERMQIDNDGRESIGRFSYLNRVVASCRNLQELVISLTTCQMEPTDSAQVTLPHRLKKLTFSNFSQSHVMISAQDLEMAALSLDQSGLSSITLRVPSLKELTIHSQHWVQSNLAELCGSLPEIDRLTIYGLETRGSIRPFVPLLRLVRRRLSCPPVEAYPINSEEAPDYGQSMAMPNFTSLVKLQLPVLDLSVSVPFESITELVNFAKLCTSQMAKLRSLKVWTHLSAVPSDELNRCALLIRVVDGIYGVDLVQLKDLP